MQGDPANVLESASHGAALLVVAQRGHGQLVGLLLGSVSEHCVAHAHCPVLVFRDDQCHASTRALLLGACPNLPAPRSLEGGTFPPDLFALCRDNERYISSKGEARAKGSSRRLDRSQARTSIPNGC